MKHNTLFCILLCVALITSLFAPVCATQMEEGGAYGASLQTSNGCSTIDAQMPLLGSEKMLKTAGAAILYEVNTQTLMYAWNPDLPLEPASLVKIMTAVLALELGDPTDEITVSNDALRALTGSSTTNLQAGEKVTLDALLNCLLVGSSNDAAVVIAWHIGGSIDGFVTQMNQKALELGMNATVFRNPHGLPDELQVSTARDMGRLLAYASQNADFMAYFARNSYVMSATNLSEERSLESTNYMMMEDKPSYHDSRVTGGRTGITADRNRCLAVTAESGEMNYVGVVLDAVPVYKDDGYTVSYFGSYEEMGQLLDMGFNGYRPTRILMEGEALMQCSVINGANGVVAMPAETVTAVLPSGITLDQLSVQYRDHIAELTAPVAAGAVLTEVQIWYRNVCVAQSMVIAGNSSPVKAQIVLSHVSNAANGTFKIVLIVLGILALIGALFVAALLGIRYFRKFMTQAQRRRRRKERRRSR